MTDEAADDEGADRRAAVPLAVWAPPDRTVSAMKMALARMGVEHQLDAGTLTGTIRYRPHHDSLDLLVAVAIRPDGPGQSKVTLVPRSRFRLGSRADLERLRARLAVELEQAVARTEGYHPSTPRQPAVVQRRPGAGPPAPGAAHLAPRYALDRAVADDLASGVRWGAGQAAVAWLAVFVIAIPLLLVNLAVHLSSGVATLAGETGLGVVVWLVGRPVARQRGGWLPAFGVDRPRGRDVGTALGFFLLQMGARVVAAVALFLLLPALHHQTVSNVPTLHRVGTAEVVEVLLAAVIVAPVVEETQFRGVILRALMRRWSFWPSALVSALSFGIVHAPQSSTGSGAVFLGGIMTVFGLIQCIVVRRAGRLAPAMLIHGLANGLALGVALG